MASFTPCAAPLGNSVKQCERCKSHYCRGRRSGQRTPEISYVKAAHILTRVPATCARGGAQAVAEEEGYDDEAGSKAQPPRRRLALALGCSSEPITIYYLSTLAPPQTNPPRPAPAPPRQSRRPTAGRRGTGRRPPQEASAEAQPRAWPARRRAARVPRPAE